MLTNETELSKRINDKCEALNLRVSTMARLLNLPADSIYKWKKGTNPRNFEDSKKLENFLNGKFDKFLIDGKLSDNYDYEQAVKKIYEYEPTNDFVESIVNDAGTGNTMESKVISLQAIIKSQRETIESKNELIAQLRERIEELNQTLAKEYEKQRSA